MTLADLNVAYSNSKEWENLSRIDIEYRWAYFAADYKKRHGENTKGPPDMGAEGRKVTADDDLVAIMIKLEDDPHYLRLPNEATQFARFYQVIQDAMRKNNEFAYLRKGDLWRPPDPRELEPHPETMVPEIAAINPAGMSHDHYTDEVNSILLARGARSRRS